MSSEAHGHQHSESKTPPQAAGTASVWFVLILTSLFIAAVNFVNVMSHDTEEGHTTAPHATEQPQSPHPSTEVSGAAAEENSPATEKSDSVHDTH